MATNWNLTFRARDSFDGAAAIPLFAQLATLTGGLDSIVAMQTATTEIAPLVQACIGSQIVQAIASVEMTLPALTVPTTGSGWNKNAGNIDYSSNSPGDGWTAFLPNIIDPLIQPGGKVITNVAPLLALSNVLVRQTAGLANYWTDEDRNFLASFFWGSVGTRKLRRAYGVRPQRNRGLG